MKTLYVSDLDGTLLRSNETTSDYTNRTINELVDSGMLFSYAKVVATEHSDNEYMLVCPYCETKDWCTEQPKY